MGATGATGASGPPGVQGANGAPGPTIAWRGNWSAALPYDYPEGVSSNGSSYLATAPVSPGTQPPAAPWQLLAQKGDTGAAGNTGAQGPAGTVAAAGPGTAAAPSISFAADTNTGFWNPAPDTIGLATGGLSVSLVAEANNVLAQRNGTNAQSFYIYNTYTDASNYERARFFFAGSTFNITTGQAGTGVARPIIFGTDSAADIQFKTNNVARWTINATGGFLYANTDNLFDIGQPGALRPRNIYVAGFIDTPLLTPAGNVIEQRNGTNGQTLRIYNTYTDASNYSRLSLTWVGNAFIQTDQAGTGPVGFLALGTTGAAGVRLYTGNTNRWEISATGSFLSFADNTYDIGASGASRPRNVFTAGALVTGAKAGPAVDADVNSPTDGMIRIDSTNNRAYFRVGGVWRYAALT